MKYGYLKIYGGCRLKVKTFGCDPEKMGSNPIIHPKILYL